MCSEFKICGNHFVFHLYGNCMLLLIKKLHPNVLCAPMYTIPYTEYKSRPVSLYVYSDYFTIMGTLIFYFTRAVHHVLATLGTVMNVALMYVHLYTLLCVFNLFEFIIYVYV